MFRFALILLFALSRSFAQNIPCNIDECYKSNEEWNKVFGSGRSAPPSIQKIVEECPSQFEISDCIENKLRVCTGKALSDLKSDENKIISTAAIGIDNLRKVARDLCDKNSELRKNFDSSIECATKVFLEDNSKCGRTHINDWATYLEGRHSAHNIDPKDFMYGYQETICMEMSILASCLAVEVGKECGKTAKNVFTDIAFDGLEMFKSILCKPVEHSDMIPEFLSSLEDVELKNTLQIALHGSDSSSNSGMTHVLDSANFYTLAVALVSWPFLW